MAVQWHLSTLQTSWVTGAAILGAFIGAFVFGRIADVIGRKKVYVTVAVIMIIGAIASAFAPDFLFLVVARLVLGLGIGGDYPVSAVLMSEYSNRKDRGRLVGLVFSMQALGLIVGPLVALLLLSSGIGDSLTWRLLLGPRRRSRRRRRLPALQDARVAPLPGPGAGRDGRAAGELEHFSEGVIAEPTEPAPRRRGCVSAAFLTDPRMLKLLLGTAGAWFLFDYAYYGNTLSLPAILKEVDTTASLETKLLWSLGMFVIFAVPGYLLAVKRDGPHRPPPPAVHRILGHGGVLRRAGRRPRSSPQQVAPFLAILGLSYFFIQFGPNMTTFVLPSEVFPVSMRTTGHGMAAGIGKLGAFVGVFLVPVLQDHIGLRGLLAVAGISAVAGFAVTALLPEPAGRTLEDVANHRSEPAAPGPLRVVATDDLTSRKLNTA